MFKVYYYNDSISCNSCCYCIVETEEEAKRICDFAINNKRYDTTDWYYQRYEVYVQTADKVIEWMKKEMREEKIINLEARIETYKERIEKAKADIDMLKACKKFLDPYLIGVDDFIPLIPEMYEAVLKTELPITFYANPKDCNRIIYAPIFIKSFCYKNGEYDIDDDIMMREEAIKYYTEELNELLNGKENTNETDYRNP